MQVSRNTDKENEDQWWYNFQRTEEVKEDNLER